ncbi:MAG: hypothetical protein HEEMFOPI_01776 [Holosporales bacterium]
MKKLFFISLLTCSLNTYATSFQCIQQLTNDYETSSRNFAINTDDIENPQHDNDKLGQAFAIIRKAIINQGCQYHDINFLKTPNGTARSKCSRINPEKPYSLGCYVETNLGYFFVHWDMGQTANVIYNIWD